MAEKPDEYELYDYPERHEKGTDYPTNERDLENFNENRLYNESYKNFLIRQKLIESNRVGVHKTSFLDGRYTEVKVLKKNILNKILDIPFEEVDETKFNLKIEPIGINRYRLYYKEKPLVEYSTKYGYLNIISEDDVNLFKTKYLNETIHRLVEKEMKTDFSVKSELSSLDLEVKQSESEEYNRKIDSLEREIRYLKQSQDSSREKDREIERLEDELERTRVDANNQVETLNESLKLKSIEIIESKNEVEILRENIEKLEDEIRYSEKNNDELNRELNENNRMYDSELNRLRTKIDFYRTEKENLERILRSNITKEQEDIRVLIEEKNKAQKERDESISIQDSLKNKIVSLEDSLEKYTTMNDSLKTISDDEKLKLDRSKNKITELENNIKSIEESNDILIKNYKKEIDVKRKSIYEKEKYIESQEELFNKTKEDYEDKIKENNTEIGSLRFKKENLENTIAHLNKELNNSDNINDVLTAQLDKSNSEIIDLNERIQEYEAQNQTLITELDALKSNFGNFVASSETTNHNNTLEIQRLNNKIKELEDSNNTDDYVKELLESVDNYKHLLDDANENKKKLQKEFEENFNKLNSEKESLVQDLKNTSKNEEDLKKKLIQNENDYSLLTRKYESSFSEIDGLMIEINKTNEREKILKEELEYKESRIKVKDEEVNEKMLEIERLKKEVEDSNFNINNSEFYEQQYNQTKIKLDKTTSERNKLVQDLNNAQLDNEELEQDIEVLEKEIEVLKKDRDLAKSKIIPKEIIDQMRHDNQVLNKELDSKEKQLKELAKNYKIAKNEHEMDMNN